MSAAYGPLPARRAAPALPATRWPPAPLSVHHLPAAAVPPALAAAAHALFAAELERGATYPQEAPLARAAFDAYFLAADVVVAVLDAPDASDAPDAPDAPAAQTLDAARGGRRWEDCLAGTYYIKPNYPGRSSHICNAGFLVPPHLRGRGIASALARSFLHYAPRLGYAAAVFNLVYVNNVASVRLWDRLGFEKIGRIPRAGRLRTEDGGGEEFVDAWIVYKSFDADDAQGLAK